MATIAIKRVNALPATPTGSTLYFVKSATAGLVDIYLTNTDGTETRHVINQAEIASQITDAVSTFTNIRVVPNIAARDALSPSRNVLVLVLDATADTTVAAGAALYVYDAEVGNKWDKVAEYESMDVSLTWDAIQGKPTSTVADIDAAVTARHSHANKAVLDEITEGAGGQLLFKGVGVDANLAVAEW